MDRKAVKDNKKNVNKYIKRALISVAIIIGLWCSIFFIDYIRCTADKTPVFTVPASEIDEYGGGTYQGVFYKVDIARVYSVNNGVTTFYIEMRLFGKTIFRRKG